MRFNKRPVVTQIIPSTAGPNDARIVIGADAEALQIVNDYFIANSIDVRAVGGIIEYLGGSSGDFVFEVVCKSTTGSSGGVYRGTYVFGEVFPQFQYVDNELHMLGSVTWEGSGSDLFSFLGDVTIRGSSASLAIDLGATVNISDDTTVTYKGDPLELWMGAQILQPSSNLVKTDTTMTNIPGLSFNIETGKVYIVECYMALSGPTAANAKFGWSPVGSHTMRRHMVGMAAGTNDDRSANVLMTRRDISTDETVGVGTDGGTGSASYRETGFLFAASNATLNFQFAQATANAVGTSLTASSSFIRLQRVQ